MAVAASTFSINISKALNFNFGLLGIVSAPLAIEFFLIASFLQIYPSLSKTTRQQRRSSITVDANGLTWRGGRQGEEQQVRWASVQAFYRLSASREEVYLLYFDGGTLSWATTNTGLFPQEREAEQLAHIIASRTGGPLRNASEFFALAERKQTLNDQPSVQEAQANVAELLPAIAVFRKIERRQNITEYLFTALFIAALISLVARYTWR